MDLITVVSIVIRVSAFVWAVVAIRRRHLWPMLFLAAMVGLMATREILTLAAAIREHGEWSLSWSGGLVELPGLVVSVMAFVAILLVDDVLRRPQRGPESSDSTLPSRRHTAITAMSIGLVALVASTVVGCIAYRASHQTLLQSIGEGNLALARSLTNDVDHHFSTGLTEETLREEALESLASSWQQTEALYEGSYLCVINGAGRLDLHTARPQLLGRDVSRMAILGDGPPRTVSDLIDERSNWAGRHQDVRGDEQLAGFAYCDTLDGLIAVHVPVRFIEGRILTAILPWLVGLALIAAVLIPSALALLHKSYRRAERAAAAATVALQASEERLKLALESTELGIWDWDLASGDVYVNEQWAAMLGYSKDEIEPHVRDWKLTHPDDRPAVETALERHFDGTTPMYETKHRLRTKSGEWKWVLDQGKVVQCDVWGKPLRVAGTHRDIDARRRAELDSAASRREFEMLADSSPSLVFRIDRRGRCVYANRRWYDMTGRPDGTWTDKGWIDAVHAEDRTRVEAIWRESVRTRSDCRCEHRFKHRDGSSIWVLTLATPCFDETGGVEGFIGTCTDISELKRSEVALRDSEERFRQLAEHMHEVFWLTDQQTGDVLYVSPRYESIFERTIESLYADPTSWRDAIHADDLSRVDRAMAALDDGASYDEEFRIVRSDGSVRWIHERAFPICDDAEQVYRVAGISEDITARKAVEEQLRQRHKIERLLFAELDHRVRNNLSSLISLIDLTGRRAVDVDAFADTVRARVLAMATVHGLLTSSNRLTTSLRNLVRALLPAGYDAAIDLDGEDIDVDARQATALAMVLHELIMNSTKYGALGADRGRVDVTWEIDRHESEPAQVDLRWRESGGPIIEVKPTPGVGTSLIEGLVRSDLRGEVSLGYATSGVDHRFRLALESRAAGSPSQTR